MTRIRFRTDKSHQADDAARLARGHDTLWFDPHELKDVEPAKPGDCWRVHWAKTKTQPNGAKLVVSGTGPIAGYAICCPKCLQVHSWTSARNCAKTVTKNGAKVCPHSGVSSCWTWTGSAEDGTLSASPSLHAIDDDGLHGKKDDGSGCGWHGYLRNGELVVA